MFDSGGPRSAQWPRVCACRTTPSESRVYRPSTGTGPLLSGGQHDPPNPRQPFGAHLQRNTSISGDASEPLQICAYANSRLLAEHRRDPVWQNGAYVPETYSSAILERTPRPHSPRSGGNQCCAGRPSLEKVRPARQLISICFLETIY